MTRRYAAHIVAHDKPHLFADLVASLRHDAIDIYAHIDAKVDIRPFREAIADEPRVRFIPDADRVQVNWGGLSQVDATLTLLRAAAASGKVYHRHSLLSGTDVLLRPIPLLLDTWAQDTEFLRIDEVIGTPGGLHLGLVNRYHFPDSSFRGSAWLSGRVPRRIGSSLPLVKGSNWWSLTGDTVATILDYIDTHPRWMNRMRFVLCADELIFHSIVWSSAAAPRIAHDYSAGLPPDRTVHGQHFIDWSDVTGIRPPELDERILADALASPALFARKAGADWTWRVAEVGRC